MDSHNLAKRERLASARQRLRASGANSASNARMRHTPRPTGGGVSANEQDDGVNEGRDMGDEAPVSEGGSSLRDRLQSGATTTMSVVTERMRRVSQFNQFSRKGKDPLARPTTWIVEPSWYERFHNWVADTMPFHWRERARRPGFWRRRVIPIVAALACLAVAVGVGLFALDTAGHAAGAFTGGAPGAQATAGGAVMISPFNVADSTTPTPTAPQYNVGVWVSDTLPQGGSVRVFVRVSNNALPEPHARVFIHASTPNGGINIGPLTTDNYGVASAQLNYGNVGSTKPIFLTGTTTIDGKTYTGEYTFVTF